MSKATGTLDRADKTLGRWKYCCCVETDKGEWRKLSMIKPAVTLDRNNVYTSSTGIRWVNSLITASFFKGHCNKSHVTLLITWPCSVMHMQLIHPSMASIYVLSTSGLYSVFTQQAAMRTTLQIWDEQTKPILVKQANQQTNRKDVANTTNWHRLQNIAFLPCQRYVPIPTI